MDIHNPFDIKGNKVLVVGALNERSLASGIAQVAAAAGAKVYLTYQRDQDLKRITKLREYINVVDICRCDVTDEGDLEGFTNWVKKHGPFDSLVHSIAFANKEELKGPYLTSTTLEGFQTAMRVSLFSLTDILQRIHPLIVDGGSVITLSFYASTRVFANYNAMAIAKAALEASVRMLAVDLGPRKIRVNAISASPANTLAAAGVHMKYLVGDVARAMSPLSELATLEQIGATAVYLMSAGGGAITGAVLPVNCGVEITAHPPLYNRGYLKNVTEGVEKAQFTYIGQKDEEK